MDHTTEKGCRHADNGCTGWTQTHGTQVRGNEQPDRSVLGVGRSPPPVPKQKCQWHCLISRSRVFLQYALHEGAGGLIHTLRRRLRQCPGRHFAKRQILLTTALMVSMFDCEILEEGRNVQEDFTLKGFGGGVSHPAAESTDE